MGKKKMKLLPLFSKPTNVKESAPPLWPWPAYCQQPRTLSFRDITSFEETELIEASDPAEEVIKGLTRSERLFFEPEETSSILDEANRKHISAPFKESVAMSIESRDPYSDFKKSMEEMTEVHELKDSWEELQELLCCYLRVNERNNHGYILVAFVDLLVSFALASSSSSSSRNSPSSPLSFYTSSSSCSASSSTSSTNGCSSSLDPCMSSSASKTEETSNGGPCLCLVEVEAAMEG